MDRDTARRLVHLARQSAATWQRTRGVTFRGETVLTSENASYRFLDGVFSGRARKDAAEAWEAPAALEGLELIGFLADEGGFFSFSPRWRDGALAVLWNPRAGTSDAAFTLTSPTTSCAIHWPEAATSSAPALERSGMVRAAVRRHRRCRRPAPPSMTKLHLAPARRGT